MTAMADDYYGVSVGCKVERWKREILREAAHRQRTTMSALLRERVDDIIEDADIDPSDIPEYDGEDANK